MRGQGAQREGDKLRAKRTPRKKEETRMSNATLERLSGLALIAAFALSLAGGLLHPIVGHESHSAASISHPGFPVAHLLVFLGGAFLLIGLPGLYARIAPRAGILGLVGFALYFLANATIVQGFAAYEAFVAPVLLLVPVPETRVLTGLLIEAPRGLAVAVIGYALFNRRRDEAPSGAPLFSGPQEARTGDPLA